MTTPAPPLYQPGETILHIPTGELRTITATIPGTRTPGHTAYLLAPAPEGTTPTWATDMEITDP